MSNLAKAMLYPGTMDRYLEIHSAAEIIADIKSEFQTDRPVIHPEDNEALSLLADSCANVPYLATCIYETITRAGLKLVKV
jgi:hypothetical protein